MPSPSSHRLLLASLLSMGLVGGLAALPVPAQAQMGARAYAPEDLWTLNTADQTRVISLEYREQSSGRNIPNDQLRFYLDQVRQSRWTFSRVKQDIAKSLGNTGGWNPGPGPGPNPGVQTIRCESNDGRSRTCPTPWQGQSRLVRQLSNTRCTSGQTWFSSRGQVTVNSGCRAEFGPGMGPGPGPGGQQVSVQCESTDGRLRTCGSNLLGRATPQRQIPHQRFIEGRHFGPPNGRGGGGPGLEKLQTGGARAGELHAGRALHRAGRRAVHHLAIGDGAVPTAQLSASARRDGVPGPAGFEPTDTRRRGVAGRCLQAWQSGAPSGPPKEA